MLRQRISTEHSYMVRLLVILDQQLVKLKDDHKVDYRLINQVVRYLQRHSETTHHPKEDILYHYYLEHYGHDANIENLELEHDDLSAITQEFADLLAMILSDVVVPKEVISEHLSDFIYRQKQHLDFEERKILPQLSQYFSDQDWLNVETLCGAQAIDPVFGDNIASQYQYLADWLQNEEKLAQAI